MTHEMLSIYNNIYSRSYTIIYDMIGLQYREVATLPDFIDITLYTLYNNEYYTLK